MKILGVSCSPRKDGNTVTLIDEALKGAQHEGAEVELYSISGKYIQPCDGCWTCHTTGECHIKDDMQGLYKKLLEANGIIFGAPIFCGSMAAQMKTVIDRTFALTLPEKNLANKIGGIVVVGGSLGIIDAVKDLYFFIIMRRMLPANFVAGYATAKGDIRKREKGMKASYDLGRQMVQLAAKKFEYPSEFWRRAIAYGTHTH